MTTVAIIDDHAMVRKGVEFMLATQSDEFSFVGELGGGTGAGDFVKSLSPDVLLLDIRMPDKDGLDALKDVLAVRPGQKVIMLTTSEADNDIYEAIRLGAKGYLLKDRDSGELVKAVRQVAEGGEFFPSVVQKLYAEREGMADLTERELEALEFISKGLQNPEIAEIMHCSRDTVKDHVKKIYAKLGVNDRVTAVSEAYRRGFLRMLK